MPRRDIVCISTNYWWGEWFRKQQFMSRFARDGHQVLYVEPSHSILRSTGGRPYVHNRHSRAVVSRVAERLWVLTPRTLLPPVTWPVVSRLNAYLLADQIRSACRDLGMAEVCLWVYNVEFAPAVRRVPHAVLVSDLVDDIAAYELRPERVAYVRTCTESLVGTADLCIYTTEGLRRAYPGGGMSEVVPNGYDESLFHPGVRVAAELAGLSRVVGFVGTLFRHLDFSLLSRVAKEVPDVTLVLVGRVSGCEEDMTRLTSLDNVIHIPAVSRELVPSFIAGFDVGIVPFKCDDVSKNVSPLKAYEYLAMDKPVVSVSMPALEDDPVAKGVIFTRDADEFVAAIRDVLDGSIRGSLSGAQNGFSTDTKETIRAASWEGRYRRVRSCAAPILESRVCRDD